MNKKFIYRLEILTIVSLIIQVFSQCSDPSKRENIYMVQGSVLDKYSRGVEGLTVTLYDKDLFFDDILGEVKTDESGHYMIHYRITNAQKEKVNLILVVFDSLEKKLAEHTIKVKEEEIADIIIEDKDP